MFKFRNKKLRKESIRPGFDVKAGVDFKLGFTLTEILIVVAIIGIILSIVMIAVGRVKHKARDAAIQSALSEVRNAAGLYYDNTESYAGVCAGDDTLADTGNFKRIEDFIIEQAGVVTCRNTDGAYAVISTLNLGDCWCVDSEGASRKVELQSGETCRDKLTGTNCP